MLVRSFCKLTTLNLSLCKRLLSTTACLKHESYKMEEKTYKKHEVMPRESHDGFKVVFRCQPVNWVRVFSRIKLYQTGFFVTCTPIAYALSFAGQLNTPTAHSFAIAGGIVTGLMMYFSYVTRRLIGLVFYNEEKKLVKIAYLSFWGKRKDLTVPVSSIPLLDDPTQNYLKRLVKLQLVNSSTFFFISFRYGTIWNQALFEKLFSKPALDRLKRKD